jgi:hypothetical protein
MKYQRHHEGGVRIKGAALEGAPRPNSGPGLLLPGALLMAMRAQLFAALMFVNFRFSTFFQ